MQLDNEVIRTGVVRWYASACVVGVCLCVVELSFTTDHAYIIVSRKMCILQMLQIHNHVVILYCMIFVAAIQPMREHVTVPKQSHHYSTNVTNVTNAHSPTSWRPLSC